MKYLEEFRNPQIAQRQLEEIRGLVTRPWAMMEVCGGQTHSIIRNGIDQLLPPQIELIHGPGCPVCVTPLEMIDKALAIAARPEVIFCSFGDMLRVPGSGKDLLHVKSQGGDVRIVYSPLDAVNLAQANPQREVVFFGIGFETTAPANALGRARAHINMGVYLMGKQRMEEAQRQFEIAIAYNDPGDMATAPRVNLGVLAHKQGQHAKALEYFAAARQLGADGISMAFYSGLSQFALGQFAQAEASFKRTLDILPQHPGNQHLEPLMRERYADAALAAQHFDVAITELRTLAQRQPEPAGVRAKLDAALKAQAQARSTAPSKP